MKTTRTRAGLGDDRDQSVPACPPVDSVLFIFSQHSMKKSFSKSPVYVNFRLKLKENLFTLW